jgi:hypothetical protein
MEHKYEVRFAKSDPESPPTMEEQIALAREAARKLGVPNAESAPSYRIGRNSHTGEAWAYVEWTWKRSITRVRADREVDQTAWRSAISCARNRASTGNRFTSRSYAIPIR